MRVVQINCWHEVGRKRASRDVVRFRKVSQERVRELRAAIREARSAGDGDEIFRLDRGYSDRARGIARLAVGASVVVVLLGSVAAFAAPSAVMAIIGFGVVPAAVIGGLTAFLSFTHDTGFVIHADGSLRVLGWAGIRELDLRKFARVTVAEEKPIDDGSWIGG